MRNNRKTVAIVLLIAMSVTMFTGCVLEPEPKYACYSDGLVPDYGILNGVSCMESMESSEGSGYFYDYNSDALANYLLALEEMKFEEGPQPDDTTHVFYKEDTQVIVAAGYNLVAISVLPVNPEEMDAEK